MPNVEIKPSKPQQQQPTTAKAATATNVTPPPARRYQPAADACETEGAFVLRLDLPGVKRGDVDISFEQGVLTIVGKVQPRQPAGQTYTAKEYGVGEYRRAFQIQTPVNADAIQAELKDGVLTLTLPKAESAKTRRIPITVA